MNVRKGVSTGLLAFIVISAVFVAFADCNSSWPSLPSMPVTMSLADGTTSYFVTTLSDVPAGYDVSNGVYVGWCVDRRYTILRNHAYEVLLYSSLNPPSSLQSQRWDMVNYILNHKQGLMMDVQNAIWYFIKMDSVGWWPGSSPSATALAIVADALANGNNYVPDPAELVAIICYPTTDTQLSIIELRKPAFPKQFSASYGFGGFAAPKIIDKGLNTIVVGLHSGPRISWKVTYYFANTAEFLGSQYDSKAHYFRLWDKWGGNLMALNSTPTVFNPVSNIVTLADGKSFEINYPGYAAYVGNGLQFKDSRGRQAMMTLHTGDLQQATNPGNGKGTRNDGSSYDADLVWNIGYLAPSQSSTLTIVIAPGKNPAGVLMFSSAGFEWINTGPRVRVYADAGFTGFMYAIERTIQLGVTVKE